MEIAKLLEDAAHGDFSKHDLAELLAPEPRDTFLDACANLEREFTERCTAKGDFCLASGCALEGDVCLEALLEAAPEYQQACMRVWRGLYDDARNRADAATH